MKSRAYSENDVIGMNPYGYSDTVWRLFRETPRAGVFANGAILSGKAATSANRSVLALHLQMDQKQVRDARFQAYGCPTTIAVGAWLAQQAIGRRLEELSGIKADNIRQALEIPDERSHCALLGEDAIRAVLGQAAVE